MMALMARQFNRLFSHNVAGVMRCPGYFGIPEETPNPD